jgi:hypothetical protein
MRPSEVVKFNILFKLKSWQSILAGEVQAAMNRRIETAGGERRINLIDYEATLEHMLLSVGARNGDKLAGMKHLITGASARLSLRAAPDIQINAGVSNFWQKRHGSHSQAPDSLAALAATRARKSAPRDA